jgi:LacI family transcriptional regulator, kdg operon repressor
MLTPALTCVEWPAFEAGRVAAEMLIEQLRGETGSPRQHLVGGELVIRESTGPARPVLVGAGTRNGNRDEADA